MYWTCNGVGAIASMLGKPFYGQILDSDIGRWIFTIFWGRNGIQWNFFKCEWNMPNHQGYIKDMQKENQGPFDEGKNAGWK